MLWESLLHDVCSWSRSCRRAKTRFDGKRFRREHLEQTTRPAARVKPVRIKADYTAFCAVSYQTLAFLQHLF